MSAAAISHKAREDGLSLAVTERDTIKVIGPRVAANRWAPELVAFALRGKLGDDGGIGDYVAKPKGIHWRTFERAMKRIDQAEAIVDGRTALLLARLNRRRR